MRTRRRTHRRRIVAAVVAAMVIGAPASAVAVPADESYPRAVPQTGLAPKVGDTPADFGPPLAVAATAGDTKYDSPGASRAPQYEPTRTIQIIRPERTIVRDADQVLPIALSGAALLVALGLAGAAMIRVRSLRLG